MEVIYLLEVLNLLVSLFDSFGNRTENGRVALPADKVGPNID